MFRLALILALLAATLLASAANAQTLLSRASLPADDFRIVLTSGQKSKAVNERTPPSAKPLDWEWPHSYLGPNSRW